MSQTKIEFLSLFNVIIFLLRNKTLTLINALTYKAVNKSTDFVKLL